MTTFYTSVETYGSKILYRGIENGKRIRRKLDYYPTLFLPSSTETGYTTIHGEPLGKINPGSIKDCRNYIKMYEGIQDHKIYGQRRFEYCWISDNYPTDITWNRDLINVANIDIEVLSDVGFPDPDKADSLIPSITIKIWNTYHVFCLFDYKAKTPDVKVHVCKTEHELLSKFLDVWSSDYPDAISGWNNRAFDLPYLINRIKKLLGEDEAKRISPWNYIRAETETIMNREVQTYMISGIATWDYLEIFRKYARGGYYFDSYKLQSIGEAVLGRGKLDYSEYGSLNNLYKQNPELYIDYNIEDVRLVNDIDAKEKLIDLCLTLAYDCKVNYQDIFTQIRMWDILIYNHLKTKKMVIPPMENFTKTQKYEGAFVKDPQVGMFKWIASFDLTSMYPSLMRQYNLSPETIIDVKNYTQEMKNILSQNITVAGMIEGKYDLSKLKTMGVCLTPNGQFFDIKNHGFLSEIIGDMFGDRQKYKKLMLSTKKELEIISKEMKKRGL